MLSCLILPERNLKPFPDETGSNTPKAFTYRFLLVRSRIHLHLGTTLKPLNITSSLSILVSKGEPQCEEHKTETKHTPHCHFYAGEFCCAHSLHVLHTLKSCFHSFVPTPDPTRKPLSSVSLPVLLWTAHTSSSPCFVP